MQTNLKHILFVALLALTPGIASAQSFEIVQSTIDGGGGTSSGGKFSVTGTVGQPDTGNSAGGSFAVAGGFWGVFAALQTPEAPELFLSHDPQTGAITVFWAPPDDGWVLDTSPTLGLVPSPWLLVPPASYQSTPTRRFVIFSKPGAIGFFRLRNTKPAGG